MDVVDAIRDLTRSRVQWIRDREMDRMVEEFYSEDALLLPSRRPAIRGREAIRAFWRETPDQGLVSLSLETTEAAGSGQLAYEVGRFSRTLRPRHGAPFQDHGKYLVVYRVVNGGSGHGEAGGRDQGQGDGGGEAGPLPRSGGLRAVAEMFNSDGTS